MIDKTQIEEIKDKINIIDIAEEYLNLKKSGRSYFTLCPFHSEKTPSFSINEELQFYHCFGCGESGDVISFIEKMEHLEFNSAVELLAKKANVKIIQKYTKNQNVNFRLHEINNIALDFFRKSLIENTTALSYLIKKRNITKDSIKKFKLGFNPLGDRLVKYLKLNGIVDSQIIEYGFGKKIQNRIDDKFQERIIFPISNFKGDIVGFIGRTINDQRQPKYLNSPETTLFKKNELLYGFDIAKNIISSKDFVVITEGNIDVIKSMQSGIENIVGIEGTAISKEHLRYIGRYTKNIYFALDTDTAGVNALRKGMNIVEIEGFNAKIIDLGKAKDIDEYIEKNGGEKWRKKIETPIDYITFLIQWEIKHTDISTFTGKSNVAEKILPIINSIPNTIKRNFFITELALNLDIPQNSLTSFILKNKHDKNEEIISSKYKELDIEIYFLYLCVQNKKLLKKALSKIKIEYLNNDYTKKIYGYLKKKDKDKDILLNIKQELFKRLNKEYLLNENIEDYEKTLENIIKIINNKYVQKNISNLRKILQKEPANNQILKEIQKISEQYIN